MPRRPLKDSRGLTIAVCNIDVQALFRQYPGVRIHEVHCKADEHLTSEIPAPSNHELLPGSLAAAVIRHECAFGVAYDGNAGRLLVIDETGEMVPPDLIGAALAVQLLSERQGAVVLYDLRSSRAVAEAIKHGGGRAVRARPGPSSLAAALCEQQAFFAFDIAGRYLYDDQQAGDNEQRTLIELVRLVAAGGRPLSSLIRPLQRYALSNEINFRVTNRREVLAMLQEKYHNGRIDHFDGLTVNYPGWWFNARKARTEPLIRLNVGAVNRNLLEQKLDALEKQLDPFFILFEII